MERSDHDPDKRGNRLEGLVAPLEEMYFQPEAESAICVQSFDDSLNSAIRTTYRISHVLHRCSCQDIHRQELCICEIQEAEAREGLQQNDATHTYNTPRGIAQPSNERRSHKTVCRSRVRGAQQRANKRLVRNDNKYAQCG